MFKGYTLTNVCKSYPVSNGLHTVLDCVNLQIEADKITVLLGKSGCGKTTLLRLLTGLEHPTSGELIYTENKKNFAPKVGMVFQESRLMPWLNVSENIAFPHQAHKLSEDALNKHLHLVGLVKFKKAYPHTLSGGMAQRVSIARALAYDPHLLLMDEPFSALDYFTRMTMQEELLNIYDTTQKGIVFVTHNIDEALALGQTILVLRQGYPIERITIPHTHDRDLSDSYFINLKKQLLELF